LDNNFSPRHSAWEFQLGFFSFLQIPQEQGIDTNDYPPGAVSELCDELYEDSGKKRVDMKILFFFDGDKHGFLADVSMQFF